MALFDKEIEKQLIDKVLIDFSEESLQYLYEQLEQRCSAPNKYQEFISLNKRAHLIIETLLNHQKELIRDIWEIAWEKIYSNQFYKKANKIYPFTYKVMGQETYYNSVGALMQAWDNAIKKVKGLIKEDEILNGI